MSFTRRICGGVGSSSFFGGVASGPSNGAVVSSSLAIFVLRPVSGSTLPLVR